MMDDSMLQKVKDAIREAGYKYACGLYYSGQSSLAFNKMREDLEADITTQALAEHFDEAACHEGLQTDVWEAFKVKGSEYVECLELLDWDKTHELFCEGGGRRIDEILRDA